MRRFLPLLLCLSLSLFTLARAIKRTHTLASDTRSAPKLPVEQQADAKALFKHPNTEQETGSNDSNDNDNKDDASADEGEDANNDDAGDAAADEDPGDDNGADDDAGDDNGDDGGQ